MHDPLAGLQGCGQAVYGFHKKPMLGATPEFAANCEPSLRNEERKDSGP